MGTYYDPDRETESRTEGTSGVFPRNTRSKRGSSDPYGEGGGTEGVFPHDRRPYYSDTDPYGEGGGTEGVFPPSDEAYGYDPDGEFQNATMDDPPEAPDPAPHSRGPGSQGSYSGGSGRGPHHQSGSTGSARGALIALCVVLGAVILALLYFLLHTEYPQPPVPTAPASATPALPQVSPSVSAANPTPVPTPIPPTPTPVPLRDQILAWAEDADRNAEDYSIVSNKGTHLYIPDDQYFLDQPFPMMVDAKKDTEYPGSKIYLIPSYEDKYGNLGRLKHGTIVTVYAIQNGMYFVVGPEGQAGWNGPSYFSEP